MALQYTATYFDTDRQFHVVRRASKAAALAVAKTLPGLVRVATPAGNLVTYVDNRKGN